MKGFYIDLSLCNGCYCCQIACKDEHVGNDWTPYAKPQPDTGQFWIGLTELIRGQVPKVKITYLPKMCHHCDNAPCIADCAVGAIYKRFRGKEPSVEPLLDGPEERLAQTEVTQPAMLTAGVAVWRVWRALFGYVREGAGLSPPVPRGSVRRPQGQRLSGTFRSLWAISSIDTSRNVSTLALFTNRAGRYMSHTQASPIDTS